METAMRKPVMIGTALLLALGAFGAGVAASESHLLRRDLHDSWNLSDRGSLPMRLADRGARERHEGSRRHEELEGRHSRGRNAISETGPSDPNTPTPDNGLFNKGARPKVEVQ